VSTLYIGNSFNEALVGDLRQFDNAERQIGGNLSCRLVWLMERGDIVLSPQRISDEFLAYASGIKDASITAADVIVPPPGRFGEDVLTADRLPRGAFIDDLRALCVARDVDRLVPYCYDQTVAALARDLGIGLQEPDFGYCEAGGVELLNRKSVFRALCAGSGIPIPEGIVTRHEEDAADYIWGLIQVGASVIVKQDVHQGGHGNGILAPSTDVPQVGAAEFAVVQDKRAVDEWLKRQWSRFSSGSRDPVVVERYVEDVISLGCEVDVAAPLPALRHTVEMRMTPIFDGIVLPPVSVSHETDTTFARYALELSAVVHRMGYRRLINIDGLAARSGGSVVLNEFNGRLGGSTHLHWIGHNFVGADYVRERQFASNNDWKVPSFSAAVDMLARERIGFESATAEGIILTCDHTAQSGAVEYCVVAPDADAAFHYERRLKSLSR
jgi:hypothetical protein